MPVWAIVIIVIVVLLLLWVMLTYNSLIQLRGRKDDQWAQIDVQLKRRADLIPNLVETVKGYAKHENSTFEDVVKARNNFVDAKTPEQEMETSNVLSQALGRLFAIAEAYPELKANQNFMSLQNDLTDTENKISTMRQFYNDTVLTFNNKVEMVPSNIIAKMFAFKKAPYFEASEEDKKAPKVSFE